MPGKNAKTPTGIYRQWFMLTREERLWLTGILLIFLIGVTARYWHQSRQQPDPIDPAKWNLEEPHP